MKLFKKDYMLTILSGASLLALAGGSLFGLQAMGVPLSKVEPTVAQPTVAPEDLIKVAAYKDTPAYSALLGAITTLPDGWTKNGTLVTSSQVPYPFSCVKDTVHPTLSFAQSYGADGKTIQVVTTAYTAGLGEVGLKNLFEKTPACAGTDAYMSTFPVTDLGAEAYSTTVSKSGNANKIVTWRQGDVVNYIISENNNANVLRNTEVFDAILMSKLNPVCVNPKSGATDASRTLWSGKTFTGLMVDQKVTIPNIGLPEVVPHPVLPILGIDLTPKGFSYKTPDTIEKVSIPGQEKNVVEVVRPETPTYPVWPLLPAEPTVPVAPKAPSANPPVDKNVAVSIKDDKGPGCGWSFLATVEPKFDAKEAEDKSVIDKKNATNVLHAEAANWQTSVLNYWTAYAGYSKSVNAWDAYAKNVDTVTEAWNVIAEKWRVYYEALDAYNVSKDVHDNFVKDKDAAQKKYDSEIKVCKARDEDAKKAEEKAKEEAKNPKPTPSATPTPSAEASPSATPTVDPVKEANDKVVCPVEKPEILSETAPKILDKPSEPEDPRPLDQRG